MPGEVPLRIGRIVFQDSFQPSHRKIRKSDYIHEFFPSCGRVNLRIALQNLHLIELKSSLQNVGAGDLSSLEQHFADLHALVRDLDQVFGDFNSTLSAEDGDIPESNLIDDAQSLGFRIPLGALNVVSGDSPVQLQLVGRDDRLRNEEPLLVEGTIIAGAVVSDHGIRIEPDLQPVPLGLLEHALRLSQGGISSDRKFLEIDERQSDILGIQVALESRQQTIGQGRFPPCGNHGFRRRRCPSRCRLGRAKLVRGSGVSGRKGLECEIRVVVFGPGDHRRGRGNPPRQHSLVGSAAAQGKRTRKAERAHSARESASHASRFLFAMRGSNGIARLGNAPIRKIGKCRKTT